MVQAVKLMVVALVMVRLAELQLVVVVLLLLQTAMWVLLPV